MTKTGTVEKLSPNQVRSLSGAGVAGSIQLIDVRSPLEFDSEHIEGAKNIPLDELGFRSGEIKNDCTTVLICRSGVRAGRAADLLASYGMNVNVLAGGVTDWKKCGLPLLEGKKRLSLERQVQLTIGLILLSSVSAGWLINPAWFIVPGIIGAGLTFAGLSGFCGLAVLISKAPWNKLENTGACQTAKKNSCCS